MTDLKINNFNECQQCGECCKTPCDLIPSDLPLLLKKFDMSLPEFFKEYLIAIVLR
jgi:Fe-S-cluster containining protein